MTDTNLPFLTAFVDNLGFKVVLLAAKSNASLTTKFKNINIIGSVVINVAVCEFHKTILNLGVKPYWVVKTIGPIPLHLLY